MKYQIGDIILWKNTEELSTIIDTWYDYNKTIHYVIQMYNHQYDKHFTEVISEERIRVLIDYGSIQHYPVAK